MHLFLLHQSIMSYSVRKTKVIQRQKGVEITTTSKDGQQNSMHWVCRTCKNALTVVEPATLRAEHTKKPASSRCTPWIFSVPSGVTWRCPYELPGNIRTWLPSFVQNTEGGGLPVATHSKLARPFKPTFWSCGFVVNVGGAASTRNSTTVKQKLMTH
jgi:hypothetical protein